MSIAQKFKKFNEGKVTLSYAKGEGARRFKAAKEEFVDVLSVMQTAVQDLSKEELADKDIQKMLKMYDKEFEGIYEKSKAMLSRIGVRLK